MSNFEPSHRTTTTLYEFTALELAQGLGLVNENMSDGTVVTVKLESDYDMDQVKWELTVEIEEEM